MQNDTMMRMPRSPLKDSILNIGFRVLSSSFNPKRSEYRFTQNYKSYGASFMFFLGGILSFSSTKHHLVIQAGFGILMIGISFCLWFYVKGKETKFDLKNKKFFSNTGTTYDFDKIKALQLLEYDVSSTDTDSTKFQLNLVLNGLAMNRVCLMEGVSLSYMQKELEKLSRAIDKPAFDLTYSEPVSTSRFLMRIGIILVIVFILFYLSVGRMFFPDLV